MAKISPRRIDFLFRAPTVDPVEPGLNSTVHLIRRECQETLCHIRRIVPEHLFPGSRNPHRMFASTILMCTAFNLLAKLRFGDEQGVGPPFKRVLIKYGGLSVVQASRIYDARNAFTHAFGVRVVRPPHKRKKKPKTKPFVSSVRIELTWDVESDSLLRVGARRWRVNVPGLYRVLTRVVAEIEHDLRGQQSRDQVDLFNRMFIRYGRIRMRP